MRELSMEKKYAHDELIDKMKSPGWAVVTDDKQHVAAGSLEDVLKATHERHASGAHTGIIQQVETAIELDMLQIEMLWRYLGLPVA